AMSRDDLAEHLEFFRELGVDGINRDPAWSARPVADPDRREHDSAPIAGVGAGFPGLSDVEGSRPDEREREPATDGLVQIARSPAEALTAIRADIGDCTRCKLHTLGRTQIVFGVGNPNANLMFVGEAPGA